MRLKWQRGRCLYDIFTTQKPTPTKQKNKNLLNDILCAMLTKLVSMANCLLADIVKLPRLSKVKNLIISTAISLVAVLSLPILATAECGINSADKARNEWSEFCNSVKDTKTIKVQNIFVDCGNEISRYNNKVIYLDDESLYAQKAIDASSTLPKGKYYFKTKLRPNRTGYFNIIR